MSNQQAHYWAGSLKNSVAFVFSTPGRIEGQSGRPVSGDTGTNMDAILSALRSMRSDLFPEEDRYYYRITNSSRRVMYARANNGSTEDANSKIRESENMDRVLEEIGNCSVVVLCGKKAQKLKGAIQGKTVISSCHFGNKGLRNHFPNRHEEMLGLSAGEREVRRRVLCATNIMNSLTTA